MFPRLAALAMIAVAVSYCRMLFMQ